MSLFPEGANLLKEARDSLYHKLLEIFANEYHPTSVLKKEALKSALSITLAASSLGAGIKIFWDDPSLYGGAMASTVATAGWILSAETLKLVGNIAKRYIWTKPGQVQEKYLQIAAQRISTLVVVKFSKSINSTPSKKFSKLQKTIPKEFGWKKPFIHTCQDIEDRVAGRSLSPAKHVKVEDLD